MSGPPLLSILVPTYNYAEFLDEALGSLIDRSAELDPGRVEIVVVDDGSTDTTPQVLEPWNRTDHVCVVRRENGGVAAARNTAMEHARGTLWMFFDSDDVLLPGCVSQTVEFLEANPEVGLFFTNYDIFDSEGIVAESGVDIWKMFRHLPHRDVDEGGWIFRDTLTPVILEHGSFMHTSGLTVRRAVAEHAGAFREGYAYGEDDDYWARCAALCRSGYLDRVLSRKRNHERSIIHDQSRGAENLRSLLAITELQLEEFPEHRNILEMKSLRCAESVIWGLLENGHGIEGRTLLRTYLRRHPRRWQLYKLGLKSLFGRQG